MNFIIRDGRIEDVPKVLELIKELAKYEKAENEVLVTEQQLIKDGFGDDPLFYFFVGENENGIIGLSFYYYRYSTWKGKRLYLEDIIITESERGKGFGRKLFAHTIKHALKTECSGMMWQVLDWNEPAINFYKKHIKAHLDHEWVNCHLMNVLDMESALQD